MWGFLSALISAFSSKMQEFSHKPEKHIIHQEIRYKNNIYVYRLIHEIPPLLFRLLS